MKNTIPSIQTIASMIAASLLLPLLPAYGSGLGPAASKGGSKGGTAQPTRRIQTPAERASFEAARKKFNQLLRESPVKGTSPVPRSRATELAQLAQLRRNPDVVLAIHGSTPQIRAAAQQAANLARNGQHQVIPIPRGGNPVLNQAQQNQGNP